MGDLLWVEGQGAIVHPDYSGVTLGLYHGCAPDYLILCHRAGDTHLSELPAHPILPLTRLIDIYERVALPVKPAKVVAIAVNTQRLGTTTPPARRSPPRRRRRGCPRATRSGSAPGRSSTRSARKGPDPFLAK